MFLFARIYGLMELYLFQLHHEVIEGKKNLR